MANSALSPSVRHSAQGPRLPGGFLQPSMRCASRRSIEVTVEDRKQVLGTGQARTRSARAVERTVPFQLACQAILTCWYVTRATTALASRLAAPAALVEDQSPALGRWHGCQAPPRSHRCPVYGISSWPASTRGNRRAAPGRGKTPPHNRGSPRCPEGREILVARVIRGCGQRVCAVTGPVRSIHPRGVVVLPGRDSAHGGFPVMSCDACRIGVVWVLPGWPLVVGGELAAVPGLTRPGLAVPGLEQAGRRLER